MRILTIGLLAWLPFQVPSPEPLDLQRLYEAGKYQDVVAQLGVQPATPDRLYLGAQSYQKLQLPERAVELFNQLASRDVEDAWHHVGRAAILLAEEQVDESLTGANQAVALDRTLPEAHYQLGLVQGHRTDFTAAAAAFDQASVLRPSFAYAYYHAGLSYYRINRIDLMAARFERFLKTAPEAPERPEVESIMRTVRGR